MNLSPDQMRAVLTEYVAAENVDNEGRIAQETACYDSPTFMRQLGITRT